MLIFANLRLTFVSSSSAEWSQAGAAEGRGPLPGSHRLDFYWMLYRFLISRKLAQETQQLSKELLHNISNIYDLLNDNTKRGVLLMSSCCGAGGDGKTIRGVGGGCWADITIKMHRLTTFMRVSWLGSLSSLITRSKSHLIPDRYRDNPQNFPSKACSNQQN